MRRFRLRLKRQLDRYEPEILDLWRAGDWLYAVLVDGKCLHFGSVGFSSRQVRVLGEPRNTPVIGSCFTFPEARGRGLYQRALASLAARLQAEGHGRLLIETHPENRASRRGIERAGFQPLREMKIRIVFRVLALATIKDARGSRFRAWWI